MSAIAIYNRNSSGSGHIIFLSLDDIFDDNLIQIEGSNPLRYQNRLTHWADQNWQPTYDDILASNTKIASVICSSQKGYLPTHISRMSKPPTGEIKHDTAHCRNGRVILLPTEHKIKSSNEPFTMAVYRQEGDSENYKILRNIYVPLYIKGKRWCDVELAYLL